MYLSVSGIYFASFYDFFGGILEIFRQCGIFRFYFNTILRLQGKGIIIKAKRINKNKVSKKKRKNIYCCVRGLEFSFFYHFSH